MRRLVVLALLALLTLTGCGERTASDTVDEFVTAFNDGSLADHEGLFTSDLPQEQLAAMTTLRETCTIDPDSVVVAEGVVTPFNQTFGAVVDCDGGTYSVIAGLSKDCGTDVEDCAVDSRIAPEGLPGGASVGELSGEGLPSDITDLEPLDATPPR